MQFDGRSSKIMIAESDRTILEMLQIRLDVAGYHPIGVRNGAAALELLQHTRPDAMIVELNLPDVDGYEVLKAMSAYSNRVPPPALIMGRGLSMDAIKRAISLGARDCLAKPFSGADALDRVSRLLKMKPQAVKTVLV